MMTVDNTIVYFSVNFLESFVNAKIPAPSCATVIPAVSTGFCSIFLIYSLSVALATLNNQQFLMYHPTSSSECFCHHNIGFENRKFFARGLSRALLHLPPGLCFVGRRALFWENVANATKYCHIIAHNISLCSVIRVPRYGTRMTLY